MDEFKIRGNIKIAKAILHSVEMMLGKAERKLKEGRKTKEGFVAFPNVCENCNHLRLRVMDWLKYDAWIKDQKLYVRNLNSARIQLSSIIYSKKKKPK